MLEKHFNATQDTHYPAWARHEQSWRSIFVCLNATYVVHQRNALSGHSGADAEQPSQGWWCLYPVDRYHVMNQPENGKPWKTYDEAWVCEGDGISFRDLTKVEISAVHGWELRSAMIITTKELAQKQYHKSTQYNKTLDKITGRTKIPAENQQNKNPNHHQQTKTSSQARTHTTHKHQHNKSPHKFSSTRYRSRCHTCHIECLRCRAKS